MYIDNSALVRQDCQKHLRWIILGPFSSYSCLVIHIVWKVEREAKIEPPSHTEYLRSGGAKTLILLLVGARVCISCHMRSAIPSNNVEPPLKIMLAKRSLRTSESHFITESKQYLWTPSRSWRASPGWKSISVHLNLSFPIKILRPSGSS